MKKHSGSCLCDRIHFEVVGEFESFFFCHCRHCKKGTGSAFAANLISASFNLDWVKGELEVVSFKLQGTRHMKSFCRSCGSALPSLQMEGTLLVVPAGSLNTEISNKPTAHLFCSSKSQWESLLTGIQEFEGLPEVGSRGV